MVLRQIFSITNLCKRCFNLFSEKFENKPIVNKIIFVSFFFFLKNKQKVTNKTLQIHLLRK